MKDKLYPYGRDSRVYLWLLISFVLGLASAGQWVIGLAGWLGTPLLLRFIRTQRVLPGFLVFLSTTYFSILIVTRGMIPIQGPAYYGFILVMSLFAYVPFLVDRLLSHRIPNFLATLIFPSVWVIYEWMNSQGPYGSWGATAYTQSDHLALMQIASITGIWSISFLVIWFASAVNWVWENQWEWARVRNGVLVYAALMAIVVAYGSIRLQIRPADGPTVRVAAITSSEKLSNFENNSVVKIFQHQTLTDRERTELQGFFRCNLDDLFQRTRREAQAGSKILFWAEGNGMALKQDEAGILEEGKSVAKEFGVYLGMSLVIFVENSDVSMENKVIFLSPEGDAVWEYFKSKPVPGEPIQPGRGEIFTCDTPYGRVGNVICFDTDFPDFVRQAGKADVDILFAPSNDWKEVVYPHAQVAFVRAIENGFSLVRPARQGLSIVTDPMGRIIGQLNYFHTQDYVLTAHVPIKKVSTLYPTIGNAFTLFCLILFLSLVSWSVAMKFVR